MEEVIYDRRWFSEIFASRVVVFYIFESFFPREFSDSAVERVPIIEMLFSIDRFVQRGQLRVALPYIIQYGLSIAATEIQIFEPYQVALSLYSFDEGLHICYLGKNGRYEAYGVYAGLVECLHCGKAAFDAYGAVHIQTKGLVECVERPRYAGAWECLYQVQVAENQVRFCRDAYPYPAALKLFEQRSCPAVFSLRGLIWIGHRADKHPFAGIFCRIFDFRPILDVDETPPRLGVIRKTLHERGVAVPARVFAAGIEVCGIIRARKVGPGQDFFCRDFVDREMIRDKMLLYGKTDVASYIHGMTEELFLNLIC